MADFSTVLSPVAFPVGFLIDTYAAAQSPVAYGTVDEPNPLEFSLDAEIPTIGQIYPR